MQNVYHLWKFKMLRMINIKFKKLHEKAVLPKAITESAGGMDVTCTEIEKKADDFYVAKLGFATEIPVGYRFIIVPRSSITGTKWVMQNSPGLIDADYRGEWQMRFRAIPVGIEPNPDNDYPRLCYSEFPFKEGDRIGQIYLEQVITTVFEEVADLENSVRAEGGFGHTGTK